MSDGKTALRGTYERHNMVNSREKKLAAEISDKDQR